MLTFITMNPVVAVFAVSGISILALFTAKGVENSRKKPSFFLKGVKGADERLRRVHHGSLRAYSEWKEQTAFFVNKQAPMRVRTAWNRIEALVKEKREEYLLKMRDARIIKRRGGISEFYKSLASVEKGGGEINETFSGDFQSEAK